MINRVDQEEEAVERPFDARMSWRLALYVRPYPRLLWLSGITVLLGTGALLAIPYMLDLAIQRYVLPKNYAGLVMLVVVMSAVYAVRYFAYRTQTFVASKLGQEILRDLRSELFHHIQKLNFSFFDRIPGGRPEASGTRAQERRRRRSNFLYPAVLGRPRRGPAPCR